MDLFSFSLSLVLLTELFLIEMEWAKRTCTTVIYFCIFQRHVSSSSFSINRYFWASLNMMMSNFIVRCFIYFYVCVYICFLVWWHFNQVCKKLIQKDRMSSHFLWSSKILFHARFSIKSQFEKLRWTEHCTPKYERKNYYNRLLVYISPTCARHTEENAIDRLKNDKPRENSIFRGIKSVTAVNLLSTRRGEARGVKISAEKLCSRERERSRAGCLLRNSRGETKITGTEPGGKANTPYP